MAQRAGYQTKTGSQYVNWENSDFPLVCDLCLGGDELIQITKIP